MKTTLFTTYFLSKSKERQAELDFCLNHNLNNSLLDIVNVFLDSDTDESCLSHINNDKLNLIRLENIPTYKDWISNSKYGISIFANADIYLDNSISKISEYLKEKNSIVCLSRYEDVPEGIFAHEHPKWSQDLWAINFNNKNDLGFLNELNISTGRCRCDNKMACVFATNGWKLFNPIKDIKCYHKHNSKIRNYDKLNTDIVGCLGFIHTECSPDVSSEIEVCVLPISTEKIKRVYLDTWLEAMLKEKANQG